MLEVNEVEVERAVALLRDNGFGDLAGHIEQLRAAYHQRDKKPWLTRENLEGLVKVMYPTNPDWSDELKARHFHHICLALQWNPELLNEDVKEFLKKVENAKH